MELKVVIDKKFAFMIFGAILILAGAIYVNAQIPSIFGHDWSEIDNRPEEATRWANWGDVSDKPSQATRWANWGEIGNMPEGFADGVDNVMNFALSAEYSVTGGSGSTSTTNMGNHDFCFLSGIYLESHSNGREDMDCYIKKSGSSWLLKAYDRYVPVTCKAYCGNF